MKKYIIAFTFLTLAMAFGTEQLSAQGFSVFNDTILFKIVKTRPTTNGAKYLIEFNTITPDNPSNFTGKMVLSMCSCYCDSIWDAWPKTPSDSIMTGGTATLSHFSNSGNSGSPIGINAGTSGRFRGRLNIWQMPGSFSLTEAFTLPVTFTKD